MSRLRSAAGSRPWGSQDSDKEKNSHPSFDGARHLNVLLAELTPSPWAQSRLKALALENSETLFWQDLYRLGKSAEEQQEYPLAQQIFFYLSEQQTSPNLNQLAEQALAGMTGRGSATGDRLEHLSHTWLHQATDPAMMLGMVGAGLAYQGARALSLKKLSQWGAEKTFGVWGQKSFGALGGFSAEVPAFLFTSKLAAQGLGQQVPWEPKIIFEEMVQTVSVLGPLKLSGFLGRSSLNKLHAMDPLAGPTRLKYLYPMTGKVLPQGAMLTGIMLGHGAESVVTGEAAPEFFTNLLDSMATLAQFQAAGKLLPTLAPGAQRLTQSWDRYAEDLIANSKNQRHRQGPMLPGPGKLAWATGGMVQHAFMSGNRQVRLPTHHFMVGNKPAESTTPRGDALDRVMKAAHTAKMAQSGKTPYPEALSQIKEVLAEWVHGKNQYDFGDPALNLLTKILVGKSLTPRALAYRFGGDGLITTAKPYIFGDKLGFNIRIESQKQVVAHFDVDLLFKKVFLLGKWQSGWVAHRGRMYLQDQFKWRGYWTLFTLQLAEWARTGNFIAIESEAGTDGGKASMADVFDTARPEDLVNMKDQFNRHLAYEDFELHPDILKNLDRIAHPWEIMDIQDVNGQRIGYDFLKAYPYCWQGILPVQGLDSVQWNRLLHRAFVEKKLWQRDSRFPVPANTQAGKIENSEDLLHYFLDQSTQRFLSSLQRMEDHLTEYSAPPETILGPLWKQYRAERIRPMEVMIQVFRQSLRNLPQELAAGDMGLHKALGLLQQAQTDLLEFKVALRNVTANLYQDYLIHHRVGVLENLLLESQHHFGPESSAELALNYEKLRMQVNDFLAASPSLFRRIKLLKAIEGNVHASIDLQARSNAQKLLEQRWGNQKVPEVFVGRFANFISEAFWNHLYKEPALLNRFHEMATSLATVYLEKPWDFSTASNLDYRDLLWGMGTMRSMHSPSFHKLQSTEEVLDLANQNLRSMRALLPYHLPLFLVKGSHFKAPLRTPAGQDSHLTLVVAPSRGSYEGGISFSLYPNTQVSHLQKGKSRPLYQVVLRNHAHHREMEILVPPQRHSQIPKKVKLPANPYQALKYLAVRWAQEQGLKTPGEDYVLDLPYLPEWISMTEAMNRLTFTPSEKLAGPPLSAPEAQAAFRRLQEQNPFRVSRQKNG